MANERDDEQFGKDQAGQPKQPLTDQPGQKPEFGEQRKDPSGTQSSSDQADLGTSGDTDTLSTEKGFGASQTPDETGGAQGGFVGSQATGSSDYLREDASANPDFATQGQGALENPAVDQDEDIETGQPRRDNDVEGGTGT